MEHPLKKDELSDAIKILPGWDYVDGRLHAEFQFKNFVQAFSFITSVALESEKMNHHPEWSNSFNKVCIDLVTHAADGVTEKDILLARKIQQLAQVFN
jgi:4a-hydroxytetrahydrobiopterin dehydratase